MAARAETNRQQSADAAGETLLDLQHRYLEAWRQASQIMLDAMQAVAHRQAELADQGLRELWVKPAEAGIESGEPRSTGQLERVQDFYRLAFGNFQEVSEIVLKAQAEAVRTFVGGVADDAEATRKAA